jgi:AcrR family transcriptional regulator
MAAKKVRKRDGEGTRQAILRAATAEFIARGFHGARMEHIAARAGVNKALVYRYYGNRDNLMREVLSRQIARREAILAQIPDKLTDSLEVWYRETAAHGGDLIKLLQREALDSDEVVVLLERRRAYYEAQMAILRSWQEGGRVDEDFDVPYLFLALLALVGFPIGFPQLTRLVTDQEPDSPEFVRAWTKFLTHLARWIDRKSD